MGRRGSAQCGGRRGQAESLGEEGLDAGDGKSYAACSIHLPRCMLTMVVFAERHWSEMTNGLLWVAECSAAFQGIRWAVLMSDRIYKKQPHVEVMEFLYRSMNSRCLNATADVIADSEIHRHLQPSRL